MIGFMLSELKFRRVDHPRGVRRARHVPRC
jgi:hypothetical protein